MKNRPVAAQNGHADGHEVKSFRFVVNASKRYKSCTHSPQRFHPSYGNFLNSKYLPSSHDYLQHRQFLVEGGGNKGEGRRKQGKANQGNAGGTFNRELTASQTYSVLPIIQFPYRNSHHTGTTRTFTQKPTLQHKMRVYTHTHTHTRLLNVKSVTTKILSYSNTNIFTLSVLKPILISWNNNATTLSRSPYLYVVIGRVERFI